MTILTTLYVTDHYGSAEFAPGENINIKIQLTSEQRRQFIALAEAIYTEQQEAAAATVARPLPMLADFTEAEAA